MRIALTGGSGFLGQHVQAQAIERGWRVDSLTRKPFEVGPRYLSIQGDVADPSAWDLLLYRCDAVIHLAAAGVADLNNAAECTRVNTQPIVPLFEAAKKNGVRRIVLAGSCFEYGATGDSIGERGLREDDPLQPQNVYAGAKAAATMLAQSLALTYKREVFVLRPFHIYGPGEPLHRLIPDVIRMAKSGGAIETTEARIWRDFVHVSDVARAFLDAAATSWNQSSPGAVILNIGTGIATCLRDVISLLVDQCGRSASDIKFGSKPYRPNEVNRLVADPGKARAALNWNAAANLNADLAQITGLPAVPRQ